MSAVTQRAEPFKHCSASQVTCRGATPPESENAVLRGELTPVACLHGLISDDKRFSNDAYTQVHASCAVGLQMCALELQHRPSLLNAVHSAAGARRRQMV